jgi:hypothetical protein
MEFEKLSVPEKKTIQVSKDNWKPPPEDTNKINIDRESDPKARIGGWDFVVQNNYGEFLVVGARKINNAA